MRAKIAAAAAAALLLALAAPAQAQQNRRQVGPGQPSPLAHAGDAGSDQPDVLLDVPNLSVDADRRSRSTISRSTSRSTRGSPISSSSPPAPTPGSTRSRSASQACSAQATLIVRLDNVRAIIERTLQTLDNNPQIVTPIAFDRRQYGQHGRRRRQQHGRARSAASPARLLQQRSGARTSPTAGLTEVSRTVNSAGQTVRRVTRPRRPAARSGDRHRQPHRLVAAGEPQ